MIKQNKTILSTLVVFLAIILFGYFLAQNHNTINLDFSTAHAQTTNHLHAELTGPGTDGSNGTTDTRWIFNVWRIMMGLANVFVALILLFFAFVNIAHIEYDTYQIKKTLPKLIIGVIMANFSMVICRMLVDIASVITATFAQNTQDMMRGVLCALGMAPAGNVTDAMMAVFFTNTLVIWFIIVILLIFIGILILGLVLLIRHIVILILAATAPVAFILLAFPPTESYFKKWWEWFINWTFMGPIMMLLLWMAGMVGGNVNVAADLNATACPPGTDPSVVRTFSCLALIYLASIVPFKLGGAVMGAYGGALKKAGKYATVDNPYSKRKIGLAKADMAKRFGDTKIGQAMTRGRVADELGLATLEGELKAQGHNAEREVREKHGSKQTLREKEISFAEGELTHMKQTQELAVEEGKFNHISTADMQRITGSGDHIEVALKYVNQASNLKMIEEKLSKRRDLDLQNLSIRDSREDEELRQDMNGFELAGERVHADYDESGSNVDQNGNQYAPGSQQLTWARSIEVAEELRFKAKSETDATKRQELETAAKHFDTKAAEFAANHQDYSAHAGAVNTAVVTQVATLQTDATNLRAQAAIEQAAGRTENAIRLNDEAVAKDKKVETLQKIATKFTQGAASNKSIDYKRYLSRNASGRRQKILNPALSDEVKTQVITSRHTDLVDDTTDPNKTFGTSEWRGRKADYDKALNGNIDEVDASAAYACQVQLRATNEVMSTARRGDAKGLKVMQQFSERVHQAGRADFKHDMTTKALSTMDPTSQATFKEEIMRQYSQSLGPAQAAAFTAMTAAQKAAMYDTTAATNPAALQAAHEAVDFSKMDITSRTGPAGKQASANKSFIDRFLNQIELDDRLGISKSPGTMLRR